MKILLAVDGSSHSNEAVEQVARRPWPKGSYIHVVNVFHFPPLGLVGLPATYFGELIDPMKMHAADVVKEATEKLTESLGESVDVYGEVLRGSAKWAIVDEANRMDADLIILGAHGDGFLEGLVIGSVPHAVILHAHCSVEIVRNPHPTHCGSP